MGKISTNEKGIISTQPNDDENKNYEFHQGKSDQNGTKEPIVVDEDKDAEQGCCGLDPDTKCGTFCYMMGNNCGCYSNDTLIIAVKRIASRVALGCLLWGFFWAIMYPEEEGGTNDAMPGGNMFALLMIFLFGIVGESLIVSIPLPFDLPPLPPLVASLFVGIFFKNVKFYWHGGYHAIADAIDPVWSSTIRQMALGIILGEAGLEVDKAMMNKLKWVVPRLAFSPCLLEAVSWGVFSHYILDLPWIWSFMLGFVCGAVAPACVVPAMMKFQGKGLGMEHGVPTLLIAAASIDDIIAINGFNIIAAIPFGGDKGIGYWLITALFDILFGVLFGATCGFLMWLLPDSRQHNIVRDRAVILILLSWFLIFMTEHIDVGGAGTLSVLITSFIASIGWPKEQHAVGHIYKSTWFVFSPLLFGLTGANVNLAEFEGTFVGLAVACLVICLTIRLTVAGNSVSFLGWTHKEKFMTSIAWIPKATVQAAIGGAALDMTRKLCDPYILGDSPQPFPVPCNETGFPDGCVEDAFPTKETCEDYEFWATEILNVSVLVILFTAPLGVWLIGIAGPRLLKKHIPPEEDGNEVNIESGHGKTQGYVNTGGDFSSTQSVCSSSDNASSQSGSLRLKDVKSSVALQDNQYESIDEEYSSKL